MAVNKRAYRKQTAAAQEQSPGEHPQNMRTASEKQFLIFIDWGLLNDSSVELVFSFGSFVWFHIFHWIVWNTEDAK